MSRVAPSLPSARPASVSVRSRTRAQAQPQAQAPLSGEADAWIGAWRSRTGGERPGGFGADARGAQAWVSAWRSRTGGEAGRSSSSSAAAATAAAAAAAGLPPSQPGATSILALALEKTGLSGPLSGTEPFTVFAPNDAAFADALAKLQLTQEQLLALPELATLLKYHVTSGKASPATCLRVNSMTTVVK